MPAPLQWESARLDGETPGEPGCAAARGPAGPPAGPRASRSPQRGRRGGGAQGRTPPAGGIAQRAKHASTKRARGRKPPARRHRRRAPGRGGPGPEAPEGARTGGPGEATRSAKAPPRTARATEQGARSEARGSKAQGRQREPTEPQRGAHGPSEEAGGQPSGPATRRGGAIAGPGRAARSGRAQRKRRGRTRSGEKATAGRRPNGEPDKGSSEPHTFLRSAGGAGACMLGVGAAAAKKRRLGDRRERTADGGPRWAPACCHAAHGAAAMLHISAAQLLGAHPYTRYSDIIPS